MHMYFPAVAERPQQSWSLQRDHVDFRGTGGYVIAAPSLVTIRDGRQHGYLLITAGADPGPVDAVALRQLLEPRRPTRAATTQRQGLILGAGERLGAAAARAGLDEREIEPTVISAYRRAALPERGSTRWGAGAAAVQRIAPGLGG